MVSQSARSTPWPAPSSGSSLARGSLGERLAVLEREHRVRGAVDHQGRARRSRTAARSELALGQEVVVLRGREVAGALDVAADEVSCGRLVERAPAAREHARVVDEVLDHRVGVRPVHRAVDTNRPNSSLGGGSSRSTGSAGEVLMRTSERTRSGASSASTCAIAPPAETPTRWAAWMLVGVEHPHGVGDQVGAGVSGPPRLVGHRSAGVAVVVADHEPPAVGEHPAEALLPPEHRRTDAHDRGGSAGRPGRRRTPCTARRRSLRSSAQPLGSSPNDPTSQLSGIFDSMPRIRPRHGADRRRRPTVATARTEGRPALTLTTFGDVPWNAPYYQRLGFVIVDPAEQGPELAAPSAERPPRPRVTPPA